MSRRTFSIKSTATLSEKAEPTSGLDISERIGREENSPKQYSRCATIALICDDRKNLA